MKTGGKRTRRDQLGFAVFRSASIGITSDGPLHKFPAAQNWVNRLINNDPVIDDIDGVELDGVAVEWHRDDLNHKEVRGKDDHCDTDMKTRVIKVDHNFRIVILYEATQKFLFVDQVVISGHNEREDYGPTREWKEAWQKFQTQAKGTSKSAKKSKTSEQE